MAGKEMTVAIARPDRGVGRRWLKCSHQSVNHESDDAGVYKGRRLGRVVVWRRRLTERASNLQPGRL